MMALLWVEGFEGFGASGAPTGFARKYSVTSGVASLGVGSGRTGGYALSFGGYSTQYFQSSPLTTDPTIMVGFAAKFVTLDSLMRLLALYDGATEGVNLRIDNVGALKVYCGNTLLGFSATGIVTVNTWYYIELKVVCNSTTGSYEIRVGQIPVVSGNNANTKAGSHDYHDAFRFQQMGSGVITWLDDLYCLDGSGSSNNTFLGNQKVIAIYPNADGSANEWTTQSGSDHYAMVDETASNDDTDYVESSTTDQKELWNYGSVGTLGTIAGIQINTDCRETDATSFNLKTLIKSGSTENADAGQAIGSTNYLTKCRVSETDPDTSSAWTGSGLEAAQFGVKVG